MPGYSLDGVSVRLLFRCQYCDRQPDPLTQISLERTVREFAWGAYLDVLPEKWLVWHGRGLYGPTRYACPAHRGDRERHCDACFSGCYPLDGSDEANGKYALELPLVQA